MRRVGDDLLLEALRQREDYVHEAADAIDVKASQTIAAGAFLAVQPAVLLVWSNAPGLAVIVQLISFLSVCISVMYSHEVLAIAGYPSPGFSENWYAEVAHEFPDYNESQVEDAMRWGLVNQAQDRIDGAIKINDKRMSLLEKARLTVIIALVGNLVALAIALINRCV